MIRHDPITLITPDEPVIFTALLDISVSICAPATMTAAEIERYANMHALKSELGPWRVYDVAKITKGSSTPHPCNQVDGRTHWFLLAENVIERASK